jgi:hypothetical protein
MCTSVSTVDIAIVPGAEYSLFVAFGTYVEAAKAVVG